MSNRHVCQRVANLKFSFYKWPLDLMHYYYSTFKNLDMVIIEYQIKRLWLSQRLVTASNDMFAPMDDTRVLSCPGLFPPGMADRLLVSGGYNNFQWLLSWLLHK